MESLTVGAAIGMKFGLRSILILDSCISCFSKLLRMWNRVCLSATLLKCVIGAHFRCFLALKTDKIPVSQDGI